MRRTVFILALALMTSAAPAAAQERDCLRTLRGIDLQTVTIPELQAAMGSGAISSADLVDASLARIAAYDAGGPKLNSVRVVHPRAREQAQALDAERAAGRVRGPLHGVPVLLKDNIATADLPTTAGALALEGAMARRDATLVARLRAAGAVILGKTNLSEFAGWVDLDAPPGWSSLAGQVRNAYDASASPSGSSSGSGVAASMALAPVTIGTETSGSILSPSEANGITGIKTSMGLVSRAGILPLSPSFDVPGPMTRSVTDAAVVLDAIAGPDERDRATAAGAGVERAFAAAARTGALGGARLAYSEDSYDAMDAEERELFDAALERLRKLGATTVPVRALAAQIAGASELALIPNEFKASLNAFLAEEMPTARVQTLGEAIAVAEENPDRYPYGHTLLDASDATPGLMPGGLAQGGAVMAAARAMIDAALAEGDADAILTLGNGQANIGAAAGYPTVMAALGYTGNGRTPRGLGFMGPLFSEARLIGFAHGWEQDSKARVAPTTVNRKLQPASCPRSGPPVFGISSLSLAARAARGRVVAVSIRGAVARRVRVTVSRGSKVVARRTLRTRRGRATVRVRVRRRGTYRVALLDPGPPPRSAARRVRVR